MAERQWIMIYLDTHIVVWLYINNSDIFPQDVKIAIDENDLYISPAVILELEYLFEIGRLEERAEKIISALAESIDLKVSETAFLKIIKAALDIKWTRNPFDRLITAQAIVDKLPLLTKDEIIRMHYREAFWQ
ncbi:MAG: PIN domain-containing protein [Spirochaetales bacterium]|nr:PIN domain-containing protein [Spirochaetales bacterium]